MRFYYDGQIRRYLTQIVRAFSNFEYKDGDNQLRTVPVMYGDITRQVANIINENSENKIPSSPRMGVYITNIEMDRNRLSDSSFVSKINVREREYNNSTNEYENTQGNSYTVERLHPTPYTLSVNIDIWSTNTEQKLQIMEQILMIFNPDLEFQTTDNYIDWTSLSVLQLENINWSSRSIPVGTESDIDVSTLGFTAPIYISPPAKIKKLGVITDIITSVFDLDTGTIALEGFNPDTGNETAVSPDQTTLPDDFLGNDDINIDNDGPLPGAITLPDGSVQYPDGAVEKPDGTVILDDGTTVDNRSIYINQIVKVNQNNQINLENPLAMSYRNYAVYVENEVAFLANSLSSTKGDVNWRGVLQAEGSARFQPGISQIRLKRSGSRQFVTPIIGTFDLNPDDETEILINWDEDTLPADTTINGVSRSDGTVDYIINPRGFNPAQKKSAGLRLLLVGPLGYKSENKFTANQSSTRIDTDIEYFENAVTSADGIDSGSDFPSNPQVGDLFLLTNDDRVYQYTNDWNMIEKVTYHQVYVNDQLVSSTSQNIDGVYTIFLDTAFEVGDEVRYVLSLNEDGPDAWKNTDGTDFLADIYDIVEWDGSRWHIVFDASEYQDTDEVIITNLAKNQQYWWTGSYWQLTVDGWYPRGTWDIIL
jgi:hypothetical protein